MNVAEEKTKSVWMDTAVADAPVLEGDRSADVVVIGSGISGLSTGYELTGRGRSVIVLDRGRIGTGMTARTTAHLASALDDCYAQLIEARGLDVARMVYQSQAAAINRIETIQASDRIACDFQRVDGYLILAPGTPASDLDEELAACRKAGVTRDQHERSDPFACKEFGPLALLSKSGALSSNEISRRFGEDDHPTRRPAIQRHGRRERHGGKRRRGREDGQGHRKSERCGLRDQLPDRR